MPRGVPMAWMESLYEHAPTFVDSGRGARFRDVDGHEYLDLYIGDMSGFCGHAPPPVVQAVTDRMSRGNHFLLAGEDAIVVSEHLAERYRLPQWQYTHAATISNTEIIRIAREATGREIVLVFDGKYHGLVDVTLTVLEGDAVVPEALGVPRWVPGASRIVAFNDVPALTAALESRDVAVVITEPVMTSAGIINPDPGFHEALRALTRETGTLLAIDETHSLVGTWGGGTYIPDSPLPLSSTYNSSTDLALRTTLDLGLDISFSAGVVSPSDSLYLRCQTFQGWAVWRTSGADPENMVMIGLYDRVNPESCIEGFCGDASYELKPQCFTSKRAACFDYSTPDTVRFFDDEVYNGFDYYYAVTSFDYGSTALTTPANSSQTMVFSPRWDGDTESPFSGGGNRTPFQVNMILAASVASDETVDGSIYVFPNPLRLGEGIRGYEGEKVVFSNLPDNSRIQIFTPAGDKVIELEPELQVGPNIHWITRNSEGEELAAGVFLYKVTAPQREDFWGKLIIIR
ncbi:MAG: aminotransferase class III-fold pyridoxal phosphate-dependent enzyme [Spirochaetales bacterium]|nr:MAG: aminotransferase class III-fold pyridoxal phosphate-dependent enzyme [Spirochaetales bacterium]